MKKRIYVNDPNFNVPYKKTRKSPSQSRMDINGILAKWDVKDVWWRWNLKENDIYVRFQIIEEIDNKLVAPIILIRPPLIWNKGSSRSKHKKDTINWKISMRIMHWYIKSLLEIAYLSQSGKTVAFLSYVTVPQLGDKTIKDIIIANFDDLPKALQFKEDF